MQWLQTPTGEAGSDRLDAMVESIQAAIEQMFWQVAKRDSLSFGVGRTVNTSSDPDRDTQLDAQRRECDGLIVFHAGKALETTLQVAYARMYNRIRGREYPGVSRAQMGEDRRTHSLTSLYEDILNSVETKPGLSGEEVQDSFESIYQTALHKGIVDMIVDGECCYQFMFIEDTPFREARTGRLRHGAEITMDHSDIGQILGLEEGDSDFSRLPCRNFAEFLAKADAVYYGRRNMRWAHYSARDHEPGRPYVVVGSRFFARLIQGLIGLANEQWMWDEQFARRWHERRRIVVRDLVHHNLQQSFEECPDLPDPKSENEMMEYFRSFRSARTDDYDSLHAKMGIERDRQNSEDDAHATRVAGSESVRVEDEERAATEIAEPSTSWLRYLKWVGSLFLVALVFLAAFSFFGR